MKILGLDPKSPFWVMSLTSASVRKRHIVLRTHGGVPVPPPWVIGYRVFLRKETHTERQLSPARSLFGKNSYPLQYWNWDLSGRPGDIVAVEWLAW
jgi:hypothetical protein